MFDLKVFEKTLRRYYAPLGVSLDSGIFQPEGEPLDVTDPIGLVMIRNGATFSGTQDLFPGFFPGGKTRMVTYRLRAMLTKKSATPLAELGGKRYAEVVRRVSKYSNFWKPLGLPGPLWFWGSAAVVITKGTDGYSVLLGAKKRDAVTFAGEWGPPAGILETQDFSHTLGESLVVGALRELEEETGADAELLSTLKVTATYTLWERARAKPQAFTVFEADPECFFAIKNSTPREQEFTNLEGLSLSPEGKVAVTFI